MKRIGYFARLAYGLCACGIGAEKPCPNYLKFRYNYRITLADRSTGF